MRILIVEDEPVSARLLETELRERLSARIESIQFERSFTGSQCHIWEHPIDLLFLDLDLRGEDGFQLLREAAAGTFETVVVSANTHRAVEAFQYGVLDFIPKPLDADRLSLALARYESKSRQRSTMKYLAAAENGIVRIVPLDKVRYIQADMKNSLIAITDGTKVAYHRSLKQLEDVLPDRFVRVHKSYIVARDLIQGVRDIPGRNHELILRDGTAIPLSRTTALALKKEVF